MIGQVYLVGAGPGDPDLITVKALRLIQQVDVILYDRLIPMVLLDEARPDAKLVNVGKQPTKHRFSQDEINQLIVTYAMQGNSVLRLKGGDPFIFGRGSEEMLVCREFGIPVDVVPGISSTQAVPSAVGIPLTHRHMSSSYTVITGHEDPAKSGTSIDYPSLAQQNGSIVILMGVKNLPRIAQSLIDAGKAGDTPAAIIESGCTEAQRTIVGTLATLPELAAEAKIDPPATIVIGEVVGIRQMQTAWVATHA